MTKITTSSAYMIQVSRKTRPINERLKELFFPIRADGDAFERFGNGDAHADGGRACDEDGDRRCDGLCSYVCHCE